MSASQPQEEPEHSADAYSKAQPEVPEPQPMPKDAGNTKTLELPALGTALYLRWEFRRQISPQIVERLEARIANIVREEFTPLLKSLGLKSNSLEITVNAKAGSFSAWLAVSGSAFVWACIKLLKDYPDVKKGAKELSSDIKSVAEKMRKRLNDLWQSVIPKCHWHLRRYHKDARLTVAERYSGKIEALIEGYVKGELSTPTFIVVSQSLISEIDDLGIDSVELARYVELLNLAFEQGFERLSVEKFQVLKPD